MTGPSQLADFVPVTFVANADTPPEAIQFDGKTFLLSPEYLSAVGSGPGNPGVIKGVRGYLTGTPGAQQFIMIGGIPNAARDALLAIPGAHSWTVQASFTTYRNTAIVLNRDYGVPIPTIITALTNMYNAAVTNANTPAPGG